VKLMLIRHTALQVPAGVCYGQSDVDVAVSFADELQRVQGKLSDYVFDKVYSSPLQRCAKLALALNKGEPIIDSRLAELDFGDWEMQAWDDIPRDIFDVWAHNYAHIAPPNGETFSQMQARVLDFLMDAQHRHLGQEIAIVTHGGVIRALIAHVMNMPLKGLFRFHIDHGSITQLEFADSLPKIHFVNR